MSKAHSDSTTSRFGDLYPAVLEYSELGFDTLPLKPGTKDRPLSREWQMKDPYRMWLHAPSDSNVGIRFGGDSQIACLECDEREMIGTFVNAQNLLFSLGFEPGSYPVVESASGGSFHIYMLFTGLISGHYRRLSNEFGSGEFRYGPGAYSAAPPSKVEDGVYELLVGDFRQLPRLCVSDILPILGNQDANEFPPPSPSIPRRAKALLYGNNLEGFSTRSEAEQSIIVTLVNAGHSFESVLHIFRNYPAAGKFSEMCAMSEKNAIRWLHLSYKNAVRWASENESEARKVAQDAINWALSTPWPGRTGSYDRAVFIAHATVAHRAGRLTYSASARYLGELAGCTFATASRATRRLCEKQLISISVPSVADCATIYTLGQTDTLPHLSFVRKCVRLSNHDAFRFQGLGKSAFEVYQALLDRPMTVNQLAERTGRHIKTVGRSLDRMTGLIDSLTGEIVDLIELEGDKWIAKDIDLDFLAELVGTSGIGDRQRKKHREERLIHRRTLAMGRKL